jgi:arylsulfatase A-like enzyme
MKLRLSLSFALAIGLLLMNLSATTQRRPSSAARKPNVIIIMGDDLGICDVSTYGCKDIPTPNIDSIAAKGVKFTNGYVSAPVCSPSRAGLLTGRYRIASALNSTPGHCRAR